MTDLGHGVVLSFLVAFALLAMGVPLWLLALVLVVFVVVVMLSVAW